MPEIKILEKVMKANDAWAEETRTRLRQHNITAINLIGSAGSGKTTLLEKTFGRIQNLNEIIVMEGDIATARDAERIGQCGVDVIQITTGNACHIDAHLIHKALSSFQLENRKSVI